MVRKSATANLKVGWEVWEVKGNRTKLRLPRFQHLLGRIQARTKYYTQTHSQFVMIYNVGCPQLICNPRMAYPVRLRTILRDPDYNTKESFWVQHTRPPKWASRACSLFPYYLKLYFSTWCSLPICKNSLFISLFPTSTNTVPSKIKY